MCSLWMNLFICCLIFLYTKGRVFNALYNIITQDFTIIIRLGVKTNKECGFTFKENNSTIWHYYKTFETTRIERFYFYFIWIFKERYSRIFIKFFLLLFLIYLWIQTSPFSPICHNSTWTVYPYTTIMCNWFTYAIH